jgi:hypothetical protein
MRFVTQLSAKSLAIAGGVVLAAAVAPSPAAAEDKLSTVAFLGVEGGPSSQVFYAGLIVALNGDLTRSGWLARGVTAHAWYDYVGGPGDVDGRVSLFDSMLGYQMLAASLRVSGFIGLEYQNHSLFPGDPGNPVSGGETGLKLVGDVSSNGSGPWSFSLIGSYSTAFDSYWSRLRVGYDIGGRVVIGPEGLLFGNEAGDIQRLGAFAQFDTLLGGTPMRYTISAGQEFSNGDSVFGSRDGGYGTLNLAIVF